jgi:hypothetical protein
MADISFPQNDPVTHTAVLNFKDAAGLPTKPTDVPVWNFGSAGVISGTVATDGLSAVVTALAVGSDTIVVTSSGLTATATVTVTQAVAGAPASLEITWA